MLRGWGGVRDGGGRGNYVRNVLLGAVDVDFSQQSTA